MKLEIEHVFLCPLCEELNDLELRKVSPEVCRTIPSFGAYGRSGQKVGVTRRTVRSSCCVSRFPVEEVPCRDGQYSHVRTLDPGKDNDVPRSGVWTS